MLVDNGVIKKMFIEPEQEGDPFEVSDADTMLKHLDPQARIDDVAVVRRRDPRAELEVRSVAAEIPCSRRKIGKNFAATEGGPPLSSLVPLCPGSRPQLQGRSGRRRYPG